MNDPFVKRRPRATAGSIPDVLRMFTNEVRFYREIAAVIGIRVPTCLEAEVDDGATLLVLENLSAWRPGAEPTAAARVLAAMHERWQDVAHRRWPWLRTPAHPALGLVGKLFDNVWPTVGTRPECTAAVRALGNRLHGRVPDAAQLAAASGPPTLVHGDASLLNIRTGPAGEIALLDWEDVGAAPGVTDLAWLLVSSVQREHWDDTIAAYGTSAGLGDALPAAASQAILSLADTPPGSDQAVAWIRRIEEATRRM